FTEILDELGKSAHMREVICRLAADSRPYKSGIHPSSVARTLDRMVEKGVIEKVTRGQYRFVEPMFKDYVTELFAC
ncbi:MAG: ATP-binding protein, partial [Bacillota bacterium]